jgi:hypothetical protein
VEPSVAHPFNGQRKLLALTSQQLPHVCLTAVTQPLKRHAVLAVPYQIRLLPAVMEEQGQRWVVGPHSSAHSYFICLMTSLDLYFS